MIYGLNTDELSLIQLLNKLGTPVEDTIDNVRQEPKNKHDPEEISAYRVTFAHSAMVARALREARRLKFAGGSYSKVYVTPDRTPEQQKRHRELVNHLKLKIKLEPSRRWVIRRGEVEDAGDFKRG